MASGAYPKDVVEVLNLVKVHSSKLKAKKISPSRLLVWSKWLWVAGVLLTLASVTGQIIAGSMRSDGMNLALALLWVAGVLLFLAGLMLPLIDEFRNLRRPIAQHVDNILGSLPIEDELLRNLQYFDVDTLQCARTRLNLESVRIASRLDLIGGNGIKASLVGIAALVYGLLSQYKQLDLSALSLSSVVYLGFALLLGLSIGGWVIKYGASQSDYYSELIGLTIDRKSRSSGRPYTRGRHRRWRRRED